jgi:phage virion morphogenesis protein
MTSKVTERGGASLRYEGDDRLLKVFSRIADPNLRKDLMWNIATAGVTSTQQRFLDQKAPDGTGWPQSYRAKVTGGKTLRMSNLLFQSVHAEATKDEAQWGTDREYAGVHQFGAVIVPKTKKALFFTLANGAKVMVKKVTIPARPFLGINEADRARIASVGETWLKETVTRT